MKRLKDTWGIAIVVACIALLYSLLPLGTALEFGGDEGYELMKGFLVSKGFKLYQPIWSDQPPIFSLLLGCAFKTWEPTILIARLVAAGFGLILFVVFFQLVDCRIGRWPAILATFFLIASPVILELSVSVMQEVPAFAIALLSVLFLFQWQKKLHCGWLLTSGALMGIALGIKLTALLIVPAVCVEMFLARVSGYRQLPKQFLLDLFLWFSAAGAIFALIETVWGRGSVEVSFKAHFAEHAILGMPKPEDFPMPFSIFWDHAECVVSAFVGMFFITKRKLWRTFAFPITLLFTALVVHFIHRPWWICYYLHTAIPLAWLAGYGIYETISLLFKLFARSQFRWHSWTTWRGTGLCVLVALVLARSEGRLESGVQNLRSRPRVDESPIVGKMNEYANKTHWVYADIGEASYPFLAQLKMPPELAVVTLKRFWSDQISTEEIVDVCRRYKVEQVLLSQADANVNWGNFLTNFFIAYSDKTNVLYVVKKIDP